MCLYGDDDHEFESRESNSTSEQHVSDSETQILGSQSSPTVALGGSGLYDNTFPLEDVETQVVNFGGETEALNFGGETQIVDNLDCTEKVCTQSFDGCDTQVVDTDDDGTERTEVLGDTQELSEVDSVKRVDSHPVNQENALHTACHKQTGHDSEATRTNEECNSGSLLRGYTALRVASIRASGLDAREMSSGRTNNYQFAKQHDAEYSGISVLNTSSKFREELDQRHPQEDCDDQMKESGNEKKCRTGKSAVRKLFTEDAVTVEGLDKNMSNNNRETDIPQLFTSENEFAGLSYINSQEPEEASQTVALDFVDRFLKVNVTELDEEVEFTKSTGGKSKPASGVKGTQSLARSANRTCLLAGGVYDWDDNEEDEGGGEFFRKKKEEFFDSTKKGHKSYTQHRDPVSLNLKRRAVKGTRDDEEQHDIHEKAKGLIYSDSNLLLDKPIRNDESLKVPGTKFRRNLNKESFQKFDMGSGDRMVETGVERGNKAVLNVGLDTQMAAEAIEALCFGVDRTNHYSNVAKHDAEPYHCGPVEGKSREKSQSKEILLKRRSKSGVVTRQSNKKSSPRLSRVCSISSPKNSVKVRDKCDESDKLHNSQPEHIAKCKREKALKRSYIDENDTGHVASSYGRKAVKRRCLEEQLGSYTPIACRTRHRGGNQPKRDAKVSPDFKEEMNNLTGFVSSTRNRRRTNPKEKCSKINSSKPGDLKKAKLTYVERLQSKITCSRTVKTDAVKHPGHRKTHQKSLPFQETIIGKPNPDTDILSSGRQSGNSFSHQSLLARTPMDSSVDHIPNDKNGSVGSKDLAEVEAQVANPSVVKSHSSIPSSAEEEGNPQLGVSRKEICTPSAAALMTPTRCTTPTSIIEASPVCVGDEYSKQSCRKNLTRPSLRKEISRLTADGPEPTYRHKGLRKRRDIAKVQVLFSLHLDVDIIKQQKKVLARLGASVASSILAATHFVADEFVRTRNMLEAIAYGKPVVTHLWLEKCAQAGRFIDEQNYILRDAKKEKEIGFSLEVSLARANHNPLLQGQRVLITRNTKPGREILASLVKAVHGMAIERIGRSALKDDKAPGDILVLSCEEDYADCVTFLQKGAEVYSSELLLNGIVTQKLEYERHRLFTDQVRRTRSTVWWKRR